MSAVSRSSRSSAPGCSGPSGSGSPSRMTRRAPQSRDAVVELFLGEPPRERDGDRARPRAAQRGARVSSRLSSTIATRSPGVDAEPAGNRARPADEQLAVGAARETPPAPGAARRRRAATARGSRASPSARPRAIAVDDRRVAGAAAEMAGEQIDDLLARRLGLALEQVGRGHQDPGVQKPHWSAWWRRNASCSGVSGRRRRGPRRSRSRLPSACTARTRHDRTAAPSSRTVQAPQTPCSQPTCVPVSPSAWRRKSESSSRGSTALAHAAAVDASARSSSARSQRPLDETRL